jgi:hypothetical protein
LIFEELVRVSMVTFNQGNELHFSLFKNKKKTKKKRYIDTHFPFFFFLLNFLLLGSTKVGPPLNKT